MNTDKLDLLCMSCFSPLHTTGAACPVCGFDEAARGESLYQLPPRTILAGKYMVGGVLGEGGFGITYVGLDLNLQLKVAIKEYYPSGLVMRATTVSSTVQPMGGEQGEFFNKGRERFVDEARRLARFRVMPGIVMVNDFFVENGTAYIVMEFIEGQTLKSYLSQVGGKLPVAQVLGMMEPVLESLTQIHGSGIIHRDISPDNIMITHDGTVKLLDFGAAREFGEDGNKSLSVMLKHGYAPAEQYTSRGIQGPHTDVYALSATIYKAITGQTPEGSMDRIIEDTLLPPGALGVAMPHHQEAALMKGLAVRVEDRYRTVAELGEAFVRIDGNRPATPPMPHTGRLPSAPTNEPPMLPTPYVAPQGGRQVAAPTNAPPVSSAPYDAQQPVGADVFRPHVPSNKNKIIAAAAAAFVVVLAVVLVLTLPGSRVGDSANTPSGSISGGETTMPPGETSGDDASTPPPETPGDGNGAVPEEMPSYSVLAVGENGFGQCDVSDWRDIVKVSAGGVHTVGLKSDGTVVAVGQNEYYGQCDVSDWRDIVEVSAGGVHTVGLKPDGTVVAIGLNEFGQCDVSEWRDIIAVSAGALHTVGLKPDGTVVAVGDNEDGQCDVSEWRDIVAVSAGAWLTVGLKSDGTVVAEGVGYSGDSGGGQSYVSEWRDVVALSAGFFHTIGLKSDGTVDAVGTNEQGECEVYDWRSIVAVSTGNWHTVGLKSDGTVVAVGDNEYGQCDVKEWRDVVAVSAGFTHTVALVVGKGEASGDGSTSQSPAPSAEDQESLEEHSAPEAPAITVNIEMLRMIGKTNADLKAVNGSVCSWDYYNGSYYINYYGMSVPHPGCFFIDVDYDTASRIVDENLGREQNSNVWPDDSIVSGILIASSFQLMFRTDGPVTYDAICEVFSPINDLAYWPVGELEIDYFEFDVWQGEFAYDAYSMFATFREQGNSLVLIEAFFWAR